MTNEVKGTLDGAKECEWCHQMTKWYDAVSKYVVEWHCGNCQMKYIKVLVGEKTNFQIEKGKVTFLIPYEVKK